MPIIPSDPSIGDPTKASFAAAQNLALSDIASDVAGLESTGVPNSNFEILDGTDPAQWTMTDSGVGSYSVATASPLSGQRYLSMDISSTAAGEVVAESAKINGGHLAVDLTLMYRTTATHPKFKIELVEYEDLTEVSSLEVAEYAADDFIAESPVGLNINGLVGNAANITGKKATFTIRVTVGVSAGPNIAGTIDIDAVSVVTRADIISKRKFKSSGQVTGVDAVAFEGKGYVYVPASTKGLTIYLAETKGASGSKFYVGTEVSEQMLVGDFVQFLRGPSFGDWALAEGIYSFRLVGGSSAYVETCFDAGSSDGTRLGFVYEY